MSADEEFAKEIAKQLPLKVAYLDAIKPAAKQSGQLLADIVKTLQLALAPLQVLGAYQDRFRKFIDQSVRRVPPDKRISPAPQILGPVIEGVRYEEEGTPIDEMFSQLLSRAMDSDRVDEAHPAFPFIIKQLSADEAKVLYLLHVKTYSHVRVSNLDREEGMFTHSHIETDDLPRVDLRFPQNLPFYMEHLNNLGLAGIYQVGKQEPIFSENPRAQTGVRIRSEYRLTDVGRRLVHACSPK
jgi:hypothetical protein